MRLTSYAAKLPRDLSLIVLLRLWQAGAGLVTTVLAVHYLSPELQGWYYSFLSVAALYTLFDLGLSTVLVQVSAHAFAESYQSTGDVVKRVYSHHFEALLGKSVRWYALLALVFVVILLPGGWVFFASKGNAELSWTAPWLVLCALTGSGLLVMPFLSVLEGSGEIAQVYTVRLSLSVCGSIACWIMLAAGTGLWATAMLPAMALCVPALWLARYRRNLFVIAWRQPGRDYDWRQEVWPLQWRLGANWLCGYLLTQINIPILFHTQGAVLAGQFGLSLAVVNTIGLVSQSWLLRRVPAMAQAVALRNWQRLDQLFWVDFVIATLVFIVGATTILGLDRLFAEVTFVQRLLPWPQLFGLFIFAFASQVIGGFATHLRSFRREPLVWLTLIGTIPTLSAAFYAAQHYSSAGLITVLASINAVVNMPIAIAIWYRCNRAWRIEE